MSWTVRCHELSERSTLSKTWMGIDLTLTSSSNVTPEPGGSGEIARPTVARNGWAGDRRRRERSTAAPSAVRSLDADRRRRSELDLEAVVALQRLGDDLLLDLSVEREEQLLAGVVLAEVDEWVLLGEIGECVEHGPLLSAVTGHDRSLQRRRGEGELLAGVGGGPKVSPMRAVESPWTLAISPARVAGRRCVVPSIEDVDGGDRFDVRRLGAELDAIRASGVSRRTCARRRSSRGSALARS